MVSETDENLTRASTTAFDTSHNSTQQRSATISLISYHSPGPRKEMAKFSQNVCTNPFWFPPHVLTMPHRPSTNTHATAEVAGAGRGCSHSTHKGPYHKILTTQGSQDPGVHCQEVCPNNGRPPMGTGSDCRGRRQDVLSKDDQTWITWPRLYICSGAPLHYIHMIFRDPMHRFVNSTKLLLTVTREPRISNRIWFSSRSSENFNGSSR